MASIHTAAKYTQGTVRVASVGVFFALRAGLELSESIYTAARRVCVELERVTMRQLELAERWLDSLARRHPQAHAQLKRTLGEHGIGLSVLALAVVTAWHVAFGSVPPMLAITWIGAGALLGATAISHRRRAQALAGQLATLVPQLAKTHERWKRERQARRRGYVELLDVDALDERALAFVRERCLAVARAAEAELATRQVFDFATTPDANAR